MTGLPLSVPRVLYVGPGDSITYGTGSIEAVTPRTRAISPDSIVAEIFGSRVAAGRGPAASADAPPVSGAADSSEGWLPLVIVTKRTSPHRGRPARRWGCSRGQSAAACKHSDY